MRCGNPHWQISLTVVSLLLNVCLPADGQQPEQAGQFQFWSDGQLLQQETMPIELESMAQPDNELPVIEPVPPQAVDQTVETVPENDGQEIETVENFYLRHALYNSYYDTQKDSTTYVPGNGDDFGWISFQWQSGLDAGQTYGLVSRYGIHFLGGPTQTDLPPRVYDLVWGIQMRDEIGPLFAYDLAANFGIFADFEDSVRQGIQFPGHAIGFLRASPQFQIVFGIDYLGQDDIKILPVFGLRLKSVEPFIDAELVFPKPKISVILNSTHRLYTAGSIGGGTWDIERPDETNDVFTYRDQRVVIGLESLDKEDGSLGSVELGISFNRQLSFRNNPVEMDLDQAFIIRWITQH